MKAVKIVLFGVFICFCAFLVYAFLNTFSGLYLIVKDDLTVKAYESDQLYVFLPSGTDPKEIRVSYLNDGLVINGREYKSGDQFRDLELNEDYPYTVYGMLGIPVKSGTIRLMQSSGCCTVNVNLMKGNLVTLQESKDNHLPGIMSVYGKNSEMLYRGSLDSIKGRGNTSWSVAKKPYKLTLDEEADLLGMGSSLDWVLIANGCDYSNLRNKLVYDISSELEKVPVRSEYADLYIDGEYQGLYLLCRRIEIAEDLVPVHDLYADTQAVNQTKLKNFSVYETNENGGYKKGYLTENDPADITGGYLLEFELEYRLADSASCFTTASGQPFSVEAPKYASREQIDYISRIVQETENHLGDEDVGAYIDLESWAKYYTLQELFANTEQTSVYCYKDRDSADPKLYAGPQWDFDLALGQCTGYRYTSPELLYQSTWGWFSQLCDNPVFREAVRKEYGDLIRPYLESSLNDELWEISNQISDAFEMDRIRWKGINSYVWAHENESLADHVEEIRGYLGQRMAFLDKVWGQESFDDCSVAAFDPKNIVKTYQLVKKGSSISLESPSFDGYTFVGWYDQRTGEKWSPETGITSNRTYLARWEKSGTTLGEIKAWVLVNKWELLCVGSTALLLIADGITVWKGKKKKNGRQVQT